MLETVFREPLAVELFFAALLLVVLLLVVRTLMGVADRVSRRRALREFVGGVDLYFKGEFAAARSMLESALERDPENCEARILLGDACREMGDLAEAHKHHYHVARVFEHDLARNHLSLGKDLLSMGKSGDAVGHLERAAAADPDDEEVLDLLLAANLESGRFADAVAVSRRRFPDTGGKESDSGRRKRAAVALVAGREFLRRGDSREGSQLLKTALRLNPGLVSARFELVRSAWVTGNTRAAEKELAYQMKEMVRLAEQKELVFEPATNGRQVDPDKDVPGRPLPIAPALAALPSEDLAGNAVAALPDSSVGALPPAVGGGDGSGGRSLDRRGMAAPEEIPDAPLPMDAGAFARVLLPREARYVCASCGRGELRFVEACPGCGTFGSLFSTDDRALLPVPQIEEIFDEVLENRAFLRRLVARAAAGDEEAEERLVDAGPRVVRLIFREIVRTPDDAGLVRVLSKMGPEAVDAILKAFSRASVFTTKRLVREGVRAFRSLDGIVVRALSGMGDAVLPRLGSLLETGGRTLRQVALDALIRLGAADRIEELRLLLPGKDLIDRLNACPEPDLDPLLDACDPTGYLVTNVLTDRTFVAEGALVRALSRPGNRRKMRDVLIHRGFSARTFECLEEIWAEPQARVMARDVVRSYGRQAADHLIKTFTTANLAKEVRDDALSLFLDLGDEEIERLVDRLADGDPETEREILRAVLAFGSRAVPALVRAYGKSGLLQKVGLNRRRLLYRKMTLLRALAQIGTYDALGGLRRLLERETDPELRRKISGIVERQSGRGAR